MAESEKTLKLNVYQNLQYVSEDTGTGSFRPLRKTVLKMIRIEVYILCVHHTEIGINLSGNFGSVT
jgi:hypothetical protein